MFESFKAKHKKVDKAADDFFKYAEKAPKVSIKKSLDFGKPKKVKKSFNSEGFKF